MATTTDFTGSVFSLSQEATGLRVAITCSECKTRQVGGDKPDYPIDTVSRHFAAKHWYITDKWRRAVCPECQKKRDKPAPAPVDMSKVQASLDKQREAEERRRAESQKTTAEVFGAPPTMPPTATSMDAVLAEAERHLASVTINPKRPGMRDWKANPKPTAEIVRLYLSLDTYDRARFFDHMAAKCSALRTSLIYFASGLVADGSKPWGDLRAELTNLRVTWLEGQRKSNRTRRTIQVDSPHTVPPPTTATESVMHQETPKAEPSREARRAHAAAIRLLDLHFTIADGAEYGHYADGWTDDRVAKDSGLSVAEVTRTREDVYGRLEDPQVAARERALADLSTRFDATIASLKRDLDDARRIVDALAKEVDERTAAFQREVAAIKAGSK